MLRLSSAHVVYCCFVTVLFVLSGCETVQTAGTNLLKPQDASAVIVDEGAEEQVKKSAEELLEAERRFIMDEEAGSSAPLEQHMMARDDVKPSDINRKNKFSKAIEDSHATDKTHFRVVRVEEDVANDDSVEPEALKIHADPVRKREDAKSYVETILAKHRARQDSLNIVSADIPVQGDAIDAGKAQIAGDVLVSGVRIGQHPGKTRLVFDLSGKASFEARVDNASRVLNVKLRNVSWDAERVMQAEAKSLVKGYKVVKDGSSVNVIVSLSDAAKVIYQKAMNPDNSYGNRIVIDLIAQ